MKRLPLSALMLAACTTSGYRPDAPTTPAPQALPPAVLQHIALAPADGATAIHAVDLANPRLKVYNPGGAGRAGGVNGRGLSAVHAGAGAAGPAGPLPQVTYEDPSSLFAEELAQGFPIAVPQLAHRR